MKFRRIVRHTLVSLVAGLTAFPADIWGQSPNAREGISDLESLISDRLEKALAKPAAIHRVEISSLDGKTKQLGTLVSPQKGWVVTSGDFSHTEAKTVIVKRTDESTQMGQIIAYSKEDHLLLVQVEASPNAPNMTQGKIETGSFVGGFDKETTLKSGTITSGVRPENKVFTANEQQALIGHWKRLGLNVSERRTKFTAVFETDLDLDANDCGGPIFSSDGSLIGVVISRAGHHATLVIPTSRIQELFTKQ